MQIVAAADALHREGLGEPSLEVLDLDQHNYKLLVLQPRAELEVGEWGMRPKSDAHPQFAAFLEEAHSCAADLAVAPEYSIPWKCLAEAAEKGLHPPERKVWALGCEGITPGGFSEIKEALQDKVVIVHEELPEGAEGFLNALVYVFLAPADENSHRLTWLVQFKTTTAGDPEQLEINGLIEGSLVYKLGRDGRACLFSLICADAFHLDDALAREHHDRTLILHPQLNPQPQNPAFRSYRDKLLSYGSETDILCSNWAAGTSFRNGTTRCELTSQTGSAWYTTLESLKTTDSRIDSNHVKGMYYTWLESKRSHALFLNSDPLMYLIRTSKVSKHGVLPQQARRHGPEVLEVHAWNDAELKWNQPANPADGFDDFLDTLNPSPALVRRIASSSPIRAERFMSLSSGTVTLDQQWFSVQEMKSFRIDQSELIRRFTFSPQEGGDPSLLRDVVAKTAKVEEIVSKTDLGKMVPAYAGKVLDCAEWRPQRPHQNVHFTSDESATLIYLKETLIDQEAENLRDAIGENIRTSPSSDEDRDSAIQRISIWYRDGDNLTVAVDQTRTYIDRDDEESPVDLAK